ncbi:MAG: hypothetical protein ACJA08_000944 [Cyclobacteriaceae bacterium]|jgi:uncharacterized protein YukE
MNSNILKKCTILLSWLILLGCQPQEKDTVTFEERKELIAQKLTKLQEILDEQIKTLKKQGEKSGEESETGIQEAISQLEKEKKKIFKSSEKLKKATADSIDDIQKEAENMFEDITSELKKAGKNFQKWLDEQKK